MDLIQEGNIGQITAVDRFNLAHGNRLQTCAVWCIKATIQANIAGNLALVRELPSSQQRKLLFGCHRDQRPAQEVEADTDRAVVGRHRQANSARLTM